MSMGRIEKQLIGVENGKPICDELLDGILGRSLGRDQIARDHDGLLGDVAACPDLFQGEHRRRETVSHAA